MGPIGEKYRAARVYQSLPCTSAARPGIRGRACTRPRRSARVRARGGVGGARSSRSPVTRGRVASAGPAGESVTHCVLPWRGLQVVYAGVQLQ
jgi:hypothetical protein